MPNKQGVQNKREGRTSLLNLINGGVKINVGVGISKYPLISVTNEKRDINVLYYCSILKLVNKQEVKRVRTR